MSLRDHLLAAQASQPQSTAQLQQPPVLAEPHIDPQIAGPSYAAAVASAASSMNSDPMEHQSSGTRKGRKELANTKRAAQNRAAQRAFRQRKESHIQTLKDQVKDYENVKQHVIDLEKENGSLREYIITLQHELLRSGNSSFPAPPPSLNSETLHHNGTTAPAMSPSDYEAQLQAAAAAGAAAAAEMDARVTPDQSGEVADGSVGASTD